MGSVMNSGKDEKKEHEAEIQNHGQKISGSLAQRAGLGFTCGARLFEEEQDRNQHQENAERGHPKHILHAHVGVDPGGDQRAGRAPNVDQGVVDRIADGTDIFFRRSRGRAYYAWFYQRDAQRRQHQDAGHQRA